MLNAAKHDGILVADNERYTIYDFRVNELTLSLTELNSMQETRGHSHMDASEIYFFLDGKGMMEMGDKKYEVKRGSVLVVRRGVFHKVINLGNKKLVFAAVFEGSRSSKKYDYRS
jgi:mannose-6-phosphate isomerase-like protein (cupin superfamily)